MDHAPGFSTDYFGLTRRPAGGAGFWICELRRDVDIKWVSVVDATNDNVSCRFVDVPGLEWTHNELRRARAYAEKIIGRL